MKEMFADADAGVLGLLIFFIVFCVAVVWLFRPGAKSKYQNYSEIPLKGDDKND